MTTTSQRIEYHDLTHTKGLLALNLGQTLVTTHYINLIHIVNTTNLENTALEIQNTLSNLEVNNTFFYNPKHLQDQLNNLQDKINTLKINKRNKRGLIDGLGNVIKKITGNMDNDDALEINEQIRNLQDNTLLIKNSEKAQHDLNSQMIQRFENITKFINQEQTYLQVVSKSIKSYSNVEHQLFTTQVYFSLQTQISLLTDHVNNIIESIQLAQLGILSKHILNKNELLIVKEKLPSIIQNFNDEQIYEVLELKAYFNNTNIIFTVQIPQITADKFVTYRLRPLPIHNTIIVPKTNYLLYNLKQYSFINKPCKQIEQFYICKQIQLQNDSINTCEIKIIQNEPAKCLLHHTMEINFIEEIENNHIIAYVDKPININTTCGKNITNFTGKLYITYEKCKVVLNGITYGDIASRTSTFKLEQIIYNDLHISQISNDTTFDTLNLQTLQNTDELELIKFQHYSHIGINIVILIIIIIIFVFVFYFRYCRKQKPIKPSAPELMELQPKPTTANQTFMVRLPS